MGLQLSDKPDNAEYSRHNAQNINLSLLKFELVNTMNDVGAIRAIYEHFLPKREILPRNLV